jgi:hypothetical protein
VRGEKHMSISAYELSRGAGQQRAEDKRSRDQRKVENREG